VSIVGERVALVGDAAGYVDAITGQGLSLAFAGARLLVEALPHTLEDGARLDAALHRYAAEMRARYRSYALPAASLLWLARRPGLRRRALQLVRAWPGAFESLLALVARG
jgi:flavin-dependent dehydrogenase